MTKGIHPKLESISIPNQEQTHKHKVHCEPKVSSPNKINWGDPTKESGKKHP